MRHHRAGLTLGIIGLCAVNGISMAQPLQNETETQESASALSSDETKRAHGPQAPQSPVQQTEKEKPANGSMPAPVHKVEITGSNIKRVNLETASPVQVITRDELVRGGATSLNEVLRTVSANVGGVDENVTNGFTVGAAGLNLRGMGSQATLVLINGRRLAPYAQPSYLTTFVDLNSVPIGAVERIEILKDGASAIYGSEAMAGVVNIIMRKSYEGSSISSSYSRAQKSDGEQIRVVGNYGYGSLVEDHFNVYATLDVRNIKPMFVNRRSAYLSTQDLRAWGYKDNRSIYTFPGNLYWTDKATGKFVARSIDNQCPADRLIPAQEVFGTNSMGTVCVFDMFKDSTFNSAPVFDRIGLTSRASWQFDATTEAFAELMLTQNKAEIHGVPHWFAGQRGRDTPDLPITHPQYPKDLIDPVTGKTLAGGNGTVRVVATLNDFPGQGSSATTVFSRYLAGIKGSYRDWDWETALMWNSSTVNSKASSGILTTPLIEAYLNGSFQFGNAARNPDFFKKLFTDSSSRFESSMALWDGKLTGELMQLSAGPVSGAFGAELRREMLEVNPSPLAVAGELYHRAQADPGFKRARNVASLYAEINAPIGKHLEASFALRHDRYSDYGNSTTPKLGLKWNADPSLILRGTYATGFRAPTLVENSSQIKKAFVTFSDPARCNAQYSLGCQSSSAYESGSNPNLKPETASSYTLGLVWEPANWFDGSIDFWQIKRKDEISTFDLDSILANPARFAGNPAAVITRAPLTAADKAAGATDGEITKIRLLLTNVAVTKVNGVDINLRGRFNAGEYGLIRPKLNMTYYHSYKSVPTPYDPAIEYAGARGMPRVIANLGALWEKAGWQVSVDTEYVGPMSVLNDRTQPCGFADQGYPGLCGNIGSFTTFNLGGSYSGLHKDLKLSFAIRNLLDRMPPFAPRATTGEAIPVSPLHSVIGRYFMISAEYKFR